MDKRLIDEQFNCRRYVREFSIKTDELLATHDLKNFDLADFQGIFNVQNAKDPMFGEFPITQENHSQVDRYVEGKIEWDFSSKEYFVGACAI